jgi:TPP-dependent pyruvate/acetoin dehydrogenase alpha subunit
MKVALSPEDLISFEEEVCKNFMDKKIRAPIHLDNGNEEQLIHVFSNYVDEADWVCGSWRQHYKCLLKGVPPEELMQAILEGKSISLCFPKYNIISSAIVGGILPVAVGAALGIKRQGGSNKVVCFLGEMTSESGIFHECIKYSLNHDLPILFVLEDNEKSVCTPTLSVWNMNKLTYAPWQIPTSVFKNTSCYEINPKLVYYKYESKYPHAGGLTRVQF